MKNVNPRANESWRMGVMNPCLETTKWDPSWMGPSINPVQSRHRLIMKTILKLQPRQLSGNVEVQPSQKNRVKLMEHNLERPKRGATQVSLKIGGSSVV